MLRKHRTNESPLNTNQRLALCLQLLRAAEHLHKAGYIHRDLKPDNLLFKILEEGISGECIDFDAKGKEGDEQPRIVGTPGYIAPENLKSTTRTSCSEALDTYSIAVIIAQIFQTPSVDFVQLGGRIGENETSPMHSLIRTLKYSFDDFLENEKWAHEFDEDHRDQLKTLVQKLGAQNPTERPELSEAIAILESIISERTKRAAAASSSSMTTSAASSLPGTPRSLQSEYYGIPSPDFLFHSPRSESQSEGNAEAVRYHRVEDRSGVRHPIFSSLASPPINYVAQLAEEEDAVPPSPLAVVIR